MPICREATPMASPGTDPTLSSAPSTQLNASTTPVLVWIINPGVRLVVIHWCRRVLDPRPRRRCVGPTRSRTHDQAPVRMNNGMPVGMVHRGGVGRGTQCDQEARGHEIAHCNFSNR